MSAVASAFESAFRQMLAASGERLAVHGGVPVLGLVRRDVVAQARRAGVPDFTTKASVSIEILTPAYEVRPGMHVAPPLGTTRYRIAEVLRETPYSIRLLCEPFTVTP